MTTEHRSTLQQLCVAVLCGDAGAKFVLYDHLKEEYEAGRLEHSLLFPVTKIDVPLNRVRVVVFVGNSREVAGEHSQDVPYDADEDEIRNEIRDAVTGWLAGEGQEIVDPMILRSIDRIEVYQLPGD